MRPKAANWARTILFVLTSIVTDQLVASDACRPTSLSNLESDVAFRNYASPSVVKVHVLDASGAEKRPPGTGTIISAEGYVLTAGHVLPDSLADDDAIIERTTIVATDS